MAAADITLVAVFVVSLIALLATGGIMSGKQQVVPLLRAVHAVSSGCVLSLSAAWKLISFLIG